MTGHNYYITQKKILFSLDKYLIDTNSCFFTINHLAHFYFIKEHVKNTDIPITFISPQNAAAYMGVRWWINLVQIGSNLFSNPIDNLLDCYDNAGFAMAALRLGQKKILFSPTSKQFSLLKMRADSVHADLITHRPKSFDLTKLKFSYA